MKLFIKIHRITGSLLSLMFVIWFLSGIVLIFQGFPHASRKDRFTQLKTFQLQQFENLQAPSPKFKGTTTLELSYGKPVYRVKRGRKAQDIFDAQTLQPITSFSKIQAENLAVDFAKSPVKDISIQNDLSQWIPWSYYEPILPFYKCTMNDKKHSVLYISAKTGTIIQRTTLKSRILAWFGAIPHWIYLVQLRRHVDAWSWVIILLASIGVVVSISGIVVGIYRKKKKGITPYKKFWFKWHHWFGYFFGIFVFTFILSGLFSMISIPNWMVGVNSSKTTAVKWNERAKINVQNNITPHKIVQALEKKEGIRKIEWHTVFDTPTYFIYYNDYQRAEVYHLKDNKVVKAPRFTMAEIQQKANKLFPNLTPKVTIQEKYDSYYNASAMYYLPEPAYKIALNDANKTWLYINPDTGKRIRKITKNNRLRRWLYRGLHTFNFPFFKEQNALRIITLIIISIFGLIISVSGLVLSKRFFKRKRKHKH